MSEIDWSKAPEDAQRAIGKESPNPLWLKYQKGRYWVWSYSASLWLLSCNQSKRARQFARAIPRPEKPWPEKPWPDIDWSKAPSGAERCFLDLKGDPTWMRRLGKQIQLYWDVGREHGWVTYRDAMTMHNWHAAFRRPEEKVTLPAMKVTFPNLKEDPEQRDGATIYPGTPLAEHSRRATDHIVVQEGVVMNEPGYERLAAVLVQAYDQAAKGKGRDRHANDKAFDEQPMQVISELLGTDGGMAFQAIKKIQEARNLPTREARVRELLGAINYIAGMVIFEESADPAEAKSDGQRGQETCGL